MYSKALLVPDPVTPNQFIDKELCTGCKQCGSARRRANISVSG